ncbi:MAG: hypothetical protein KAS32_28830 [Candidatus Peribacteraceae bacterium]|nr:hypothetical protein [Candidatus Peribacteraceae bacterium]
MSLANKGAFELGKKAWGVCNLPHQDEEFNSMFGECSDLAELKEEWKKGHEFQCKETTGYSVKFMMNLYYEVGRPIPLEEVTAGFLADPAGWLYCRKAGGFFYIPTAHHLIKANSLLEIFYEYEEDKLTFGRNYPYRGGEIFLSHEGNALKSSLFDGERYAVGFEESMNDDELDVIGYEYEVQEKHYT